jgi:hypothetical protein
VAREWGDEIDRRAQDVVAGDARGLSREQLSALLAARPSDARAELERILTSRREGSGRSACAVPPAAATSVRVCVLDASGWIPVRACSIYGALRCIGRHDCAASRLERRPRTCRASPRAAHPRYGFRPASDANPTSTVRPTAPAVNLRPLRCRQVAANPAPKRGIGRNSPEPNGNQNSELSRCFIGQVASRLAISECKNRRSIPGAARSSIAEMM